MEENHNDTKFEVNDGLFSDDLTIQLEFTYVHFFAFTGFYLPSFSMLLFTGLVSYLDYFPLSSYLLWRPVSLSRHDRLPGYFGLLWLRVATTGSHRLRDCVLEVAGFVIQPLDECGGVLR